jgi:hypothetical protein
MRGAAWTAIAFATFGSGAAAAKVGAAPTATAGAPADLPVVTPTGADPGAGGTEEYDRRTKELDERLDNLLAIPEIPAAFALGVSTETVAHPGTLRDAVAAVTAHLGTDGSLEPGLAVEGAPLRPLFLKYDVDEWKEKPWWWQPIDSLRLSLATASDPAAAAGTNAPTLASAGFRVSIIDQRDYRNNSTFVRQVRTALTSCFPGGGKAKPGDGGKNPSRVVVAGPCEADLTKTLDDLSKTLKNGHRLELDAAVTFAQSQPATSVDWRSARLWAAWDWAFGAGTVGAALDAQLRDPGGGASRVSDATVGIRAALGQEAVSWSVSALLGEIGQTPDDHNPVFRYGSALSLKVARYGVARAGLQGSHDFDNGVDSAILSVSLAAANGETIFSRAYTSRGQAP